MTRSKWTDLAFGLWAAALFGAALTVGVTAAPAPRPKEMPPQAIGAGIYRHTWSWCEGWTMSLTAGGDYLAVSPAGSRWEGAYTWDARTRTLSVEESSDLGETWLRWQCVLDADGGGTTTGDVTVDIRIWQDRPAR